MLTFNACTRTENFDLINYGKAYFVLTLHLCVVKSYCLKGGCKRLCLLRC